MPIKTGPWIARAALFIGAGLLVACNEAADHPLRASLIDSVFESAPDSSLAMNHVTVTALSGFLPVEASNSIYHYPPHPDFLGLRDPLPANTAVGIGRRQSYEIVGTITVDTDDVNKVSQDLFEVQAAAKRAANAAMKEAELRQELEAKEAEAKAEKEKKEKEAKESKDKPPQPAPQPAPVTPAPAPDSGAPAPALAPVTAPAPIAAPTPAPAPQPTPAPEDAAHDAAAGAAKETRDVAAKSGAALSSDAKPPAAKSTGTIEDLRGAVDAAVTARETAESTLEAWQRTLRADLDAHPGIIIIEWSAKKKSGAAIDAGARLTAGYQRDEARAGFAVLGGFKVSHLFFGSDFKAMIALLQEEDRQYFRLASIPTYLLQVQHIRYQSKLDVEAAFGGAFEIRASDFHGKLPVLRDIDKVRISGYANAIAHLSNTGSIRGMKWTPFPVDLSNPRTRLWGQNENGDWVPPSDVAPGEEPDVPVWTTLEVVLTSLKGYVVNSYENRFPEDANLALPFFPAACWCDESTINSMRDRNAKLAALRGLIVEDRHYEIRTVVRKPLERLRCQMDRYMESSRALARDFPDQWRELCTGDSAACKSVHADFACALNCLDNLRAEMDKVRTDDVAKLFAEPKLGVEGNESGIVAAALSAAWDFEQLSDALEARRTYLREHPPKCPAAQSSSGGTVTAGVSK